MAELNIKRPKGTQDITPKEVNKWQTIEGVCKSAAEDYGFSEIRTPTFEDTKLFVRSVGDATDVVQKEMYTVTSKGDSEFTLKPEGTAGVIRAVIENGMLNEAFPQKLFYITQCFRHEKPQAGRLREFHQFGCEMIGTKSPVADADLIMLAADVLERIGITGTKLNINSIGCPSCRAEYTKALRKYFSKYTDTLCETCISRLEKNPMRILDCKSPVCSGIAKDAPVILDYLCDECKEHFNKLKSILDAMGIEYSVNPRIVRGLDYYTKTVFEFICDNIGAQATVCGGGRYDGLVQELGGADTPALGFAMGIERLLIAAKQCNAEFIEHLNCDIYLASIGEDALLKTAQLARDLRGVGFVAEYDIVGRSLNAQMKYANKINAKFSAVIGDDDIKKGVVRVKNMETGEIDNLSLDDSFLDRFSDVLTSYVFGDEFLLDKD